MKTSMQIRGISMRSVLTRGLAVTTLTGTIALATPTTEYWTPACADIQPWKIVHLGVDNYFTTDKKASSGDQGAFPTDVGLTVGILPFEKFQAEIGLDALYPSDCPYYINAKVGVPENALFAGSPAVNVGVFNVGFKKDATDQNVLDVIVGTTLPFDLGRLHAGAYIGNRKVLVDGDGKPEAAGWMVGYDRVLVPDKLSIAADYISGHNALGGGGVGLCYYFAKNVSLLFGPVWFNDKAINGSTKWTTQLDVNF